MGKFRDQFCARYSRDSAKKLTKEIKDDLNRKMLQKEADLNLSQVIQGKYKRRGY